MSFLDRVRRMLGRDDGAPERLQSPDALVLLTRVPGEPEALMLQELLRNEGIHTLVRSRSWLSAPHTVAGPWGGWELMVMRRDLRRGSELLEVEHVD